MAPKTFNRLVQNLKRDGGLTSAILAYAEDDGSLRIISGHHRAKAAVVAGLTEVRVIVITSRLDADRLTAIQLSHNAITGEDDSSILKALYESLSAFEKSYSGIDEAAFGNLGKLDLAGLSVGSIAYEELTISFLPMDREIFATNLERLRKAMSRTRPLTVLAARYEDFDRFFDAMVNVKERQNITNNAAALCAMAELAVERLNEMEGIGNAEGNTGQGRRKAPEAAEEHADTGGRKRSPARKRGNSVARRRQAEG